ncbi:MAG TPA: hypothetical protein VIU93_12595 [Gallionellaceae bacterium]
MVPLNEALQTAAASIPDCMAAGYIDLSTGMLLGIKSVESQPTEVVELLAAATADLFQGPNIRMIERVFKMARGVKAHRHRYFQEIIINSDNLIHVFIRGQNEEHVACFICRRAVNLGMALTKARSTMPALDASLC